jgi:hypothetical protein
MPDGEATPGKQPDDTITVGQHRFDPVAEPVRARRRARPSTDAAAGGGGPTAGRRRTSPASGTGTASP